MGYLRYIIRSIALILLLATVSSARPGIRYIDRSLLYERSSHDITTSDDQLRSLAISHPVPAHLPSKRMMPGFSPSAKRLLKMNMVHFEKIRTITPIDKASLFFSNFYANIAHEAANAWARLPRQEYLTLKEGNFILIFNAIGDTIPWEVVKELAERLWLCSQKGLTDMFNIYFTNEAGDIGLRVTLSLVDECLSSGSGDFCYRDGSVESVTGPDPSQALGSHPFRY